MTKPIHASSEFSRGWRVLLASLLGTACGASPIPYNTIGFFIEPLQREFGWSRAEISVGITIYGVLGALLAPLFGWMADRYGVRRVALGSLAAFGLVFASFAVVPGSLLGFYTLWILVGLVGIGSTPITWSRAINLWFFKSRGLALGLTLLGTSLTAMFLPKLTVFLIQNYGWRSTYGLIALLPLGVALPVGLLWFREPRPEERPAELTAAVQDSSTSTPPGGLLGRSLAEAVREPRFWLLWLSIVLINIAYGGALVHMPSMLGAQGFTKEAATVMGAFGLSIFFGRIITGFLLDRIWAPLVTFPILCLPAISCWILTSEYVLSLQMAFIAAFLLGLAGGAETDLIAYLSGRYFGMAHYGQIYGVLYMAFGISTGISPTLYGWVRDTTGSYDAMLQIATVLFLIGASLILLLGPYPDFTKERATT